MFYVYIPTMNFLYLTGSEIQPGQPDHSPARPDTMGENNTRTALKSCGVKSMETSHAIFNIMIILSQRLEFNVFSIAKVMAGKGLGGYGTIT